MNLQFKNLYAGHESVSGAASPGLVQGGGAQKECCRSGRTHLHRLRIQTIVWGKVILFFSTGKSIQNDKANSKREYVFEGRKKNSQLQVPVVSFERIGILKEWVIPQDTVTSRLFVLSTTIIIPY